MNRVARAALALSLIAALTPAVEAAPPPTGRTSPTAGPGTGGSPSATVRSLDWLAGRWVGAGKGSRFEETWSGPDGGSMVGMFRLVAGERVRFYELIVIEQEPGGPVMRIKHFDPGLRGWEERNDSMAFPLRSAKEREALFEAADGTERLIYRRTAGNSLSVRLEKSGKGKPTTVDFLFEKR